MFGYNYPMGIQLTDSYGRKINYLRLSVTDRCNLRCQYCMPEQGVGHKEHHEILRYEELLRIARAAVAIGIEKVRITGGEPLVRAGIIPFLSQLAAIPGLHHLALTTNGLLLPELAVDLHLAGVQRLNISLDSLRPDRFALITRGGDVNMALEGIGAAFGAGFPPPKINMVVMRGINDDELFDFAALTISHGVTVRFIEYMPAIADDHWPDRTVAGQELLDRLSTRYRLESVDKGVYAGPSRDFRIIGAPGTIGIITAISGHFCNECNRIRVTADGRMRGCLFNDETLDLRPILNRNDDHLLQETLKGMISRKPQQHGIEPGQRTVPHTHFTMSGIGG